jgi:hypothetical protein
MERRIVYRRSGPFESKQGRDMIALFAVIGMLTVSRGG